MLFLAIKSLYREMENIEKEFENKMARINDKVLHLVESGTVKKTTEFEYQRLRNVSRKSNILIMDYFICLIENVLKCHPIKFIFSVMICCCYYTAQSTENNFNLDTPKYDIKSDNVFLFEYKMQRFNLLRI